MNRINMFFDAKFFIWKNLFHDKGNITAEKIGPGLENYLQQTYKVEKTEMHVDDMMREY